MYLGMVHLNKILLLRKSGYEVATRVSRYRYIAKGAEYLFENRENSNVTENFDGTLHLRTKNVIRMALDGCTNRPYYRIVVANKYSKRDTEEEQLGTFDPMPNMFNEKLCALNFERIKYHLAMGAYPAKPVRRLLGLCGFMPLDPTLIIFAKGLRRRREIERRIAEKESQE